MTYIVLLSTLLLGAYDSIHYLAFSYPFLWNFPGMRIDPFGVGLVQGALSFVTLMTAGSMLIFHKKLAVSIFLPLPVLIYSILDYPLSSPAVRQILGSDRYTFKISRYYSAPKSR